MPNAFSNLVPTQADPFASVATATNPDTQTALPPSYVDRTARLAAVATTPTTPDKDILFQNLDQATQIARNAIQTAGDLSIREEAATRQQQQDLQGVLGVAAMPNVGNLGETTNIARATQAVMNESIERRKEYALEQQAVEKIQDMAAAGNYTQARILSDNIIHGSADDVIRDFNTKQLIMQREIDKAQIDDHDKPWFSHLTDFVAGMLPIPLVASGHETGNVDVPGLIKHWYDGILAGDRLQREASSLWQMPTADFAKYVRDELIPNVDKHSTFLGYKNQSEKLNLLTSLGSHTPAAWETNLQNSVDNFGLLPFTKLGKAAVSIPSLLIRNGARAEAAGLVSRAAEQVLAEGSAAAEATTGLSQKEIEQNLLVTAANPEGPASTIPVSGEATAALDRSRALTEGLTSILQQPGRMTAEEQRVALDNFVDQTTKGFQNDVLDYSIKTEKTMDGSELKYGEFTLGKKTGGLYLTESTARRAASSMGYPEAEIIRDESGGYGVKVRMNTGEAGNYTNIKVRATNDLSRRVLNSRIVGDEFLADQMQLSGNTRNKIVKYLDTTYGPTFRGLAGHEREAVSQVLAAGEDKGVWFTKDEFHQIIDRSYKRSASDREWAAYSAARDINDIEYGFRNDVMYKEKFLKGFQTAKIDDIDFHGNALVNRNLERVPIERTYDVERGIHYTRESPLTEDKLARYKNEGHIIVSTEEPVHLPDGTVVKNFLVKAKNAEISPLSRNQLAYRAGGHRFYEGKYFAKQASIGLQPDTLEKYLKNPKTYINGTTKAEVEAWTSRMEAARQALLAGADKSEIDLILGGDKGLPTAEEFIDGMDKGVFEKHSPFVTLYDREMPEEYLRVDQAAVDFRDPDETGYNGWLRTNGRMYYSKKGEALPDYRGQRAPTLDAFKAINRSIMNVANLSSFSDFKINSIERWVNNFGEFLMNRKAGQSDYSQFAHLELKPDTPYNIKQAALAQRDIIRRNIGWKTDWDRAKEQFSRSVIEWVGGDSPEGFRNAAARGLTNWFENNNPVQALRGIAFDAKLGLFNPGQLFVQAGTMAASIALSPKHGFASMLTSGPLRAYLTKAGTENMLDLLAKKGLWKEAGFANEQDMKHFFRTAKDSGFFDFGGSHQLINDYGANAAIDGSKDAIRQVREAGRFFFNEAEMWNRMTAWHIAWKETAENFPKLEKDTEEFARRLAGRAEDYSFRMSQQSQAWWQKGLLSIPTQFWAYNARMMEAMFGPGFTGAQKRRLVLSQFLLYGSAGLPVVPFITEKIKASGGDPSKFGLDTVGGALDRGLLDEAMYHVTGADVDFGKRYGTGNWLGDTVSDIFGWGAYGDKSAADLMGGATFAITGQFGKGLYDLAKYAIAEGGAEDKPLQADALMQVAQNVSSVSSVLKAYMILQYHTYKTTTGTTVGADLPDATALGVALGFQPQSQEDVSIMMSHEKARTKAVTDAAKVLNNFRTDWVNQPDNRETIELKMNTFMRLLKPELRQEVQRKVNRNMQPSLKDSLVQQIQRQALADRQAREFDNTNGQ